MGARIDELRLAARYVDAPGLDPHITAAADGAAVRLTRSVDDRRHSSGHSSSTEADGDAFDSTDNGSAPF